MNTIGDQIQSQNLLKIKRIIDNDNNGDKFKIEDIFTSFNRIIIQLNFKFRK